MLTLESKIDKTYELMKKVLSVYRNPVVMSSFGKDSMVMLDLIMRAFLKFPVLFHREPFFPEKYKFANQMIEAGDYTVYDYPPSGTSLIKNGPVMEIVNWYSVGSKFSYLPTGIKEPEAGKPFLCGLRDLYRKPTAQNFSFPWDLVFIGHKNSDRDVILGAVPLAVDLKQNVNGPDYFFPLRHFTDEDIWEYHKKFDVPVHVERYDPTNGFAERKDVSANPDYFPACTLCMDRDQPKSVHCPLIDQQISNISAELQYTEPARPSYLATPEKPELIQ
jgi:hypothetical protein